MAPTNWSRQNSSSLDVVANYELICSRFARPRLWDVAALSVGVGWERKVEATLITGTRKQVINDQRQQKRV